MFPLYSNMTGTQVLEGGCCFLYSQKDLRRVGTSLNSISLYLIQQPTHQAPEY